MDSATQEAKKGTEKKTTGTPGGVRTSRRLSDLKKPSVGRLTEDTDIVCLGEPSLTSTPTPDRNRQAQATTQAPAAGKQNNAKVTGHFSVPEVPSLTGPKGKKRKRATSISVKTHARRRRTMSVPSVHMRSNSSSSESECHDGDPFFAKMKKYMGRQFKGVNAKISSIDCNVVSLGNSLNGLTKKVETNAGEIVALKAVMETREKATVDVIRSEVRKAIDLEMVNLKSKSPVETGRIAMEIEKINTEMDRIRTAQSNPGHITRPASVSGTPSDAFNDTEKQYWWARRSVRIWPVGTDSQGGLWEAVGNFFHRTMEIPEESLPEEAVETVRRLHPTKRKNDNRTQGRIRDEVLVVFHDVSTRDMIFSYATNLSKTNGTSHQAGVRMEIPPHLTGIFKTLDSHGHLLRDRHGPGVRRSIKFDDVEMSLYMDLKLPNEESWLKVDYATALEELRFVQRERTSLNRQRINDIRGTEPATRPPTPTASTSVGTKERTTTLPPSATLSKFSKPWGHRMG